MKPLPILLAGILLFYTHALMARGGGGFHGGDFGAGGFREGSLDDAGFREEVPRIEENTVDGADIDRAGDGSADIRVSPEGDDTANVNVRTAGGQDYDTTVAGPDGYRAGYVWQDGGYVAVDCDPFVPYAAPFGTWAGWNIVTQPDYVQYPVYATYPVETAVQVALQKLGLYTGPIDGKAASCAGAIEQYQSQNGMPVTGTISPELLTALGIQATFQ